MNGYIRNPSTMKKLDFDTEFMRGVREALPVVIGFIPFALVLGAQSIAKGLSVIEVPMMTGLNFGGGSEFVAINLWTNPPQILLIVFMSILVNSRHILMGATLSPYIRHLPKRKVLPSLFLMCDESWAMALSDIKNKGIFSLNYYLGVSLFLYFTWVIFTALGACLAPYIGNLEQFGFDMAFTAVFLVLLKGMWKNFSSSFPWAISLIIACFTYAYIPGAWYVLTGSIAGLAFSYIKGPQND